MVLDLRRIRSLIEEDPKEALLQLSKANNQGRYEPLLKNATASLLPGDTRSSLLAQTNLSTDREADAYESSSELGAALISPTLRTHRRNRRKANLIGGRAKSEVGIRSRDITRL